MRKYSKFFKRTQSWVLVLAIMMSVMNPIWALSVIAEDGDEAKPVTMTIAEVIANNYDLTDAERDVLETKLLVGDDLTFTRPVNSDDLIKVNADEKLITVSDYNKDGNGWKINSVNIVVGETVVETVEIVDGKGNYKYDENAFSVVAEYVLDIEVAEELQERLINASEYIYNSLPSMAKVSDASSSLSAVEMAMETMVLLATEGIKIKIEMGTIVLEPDLVWDNDDSDASTLKLDEQMTDNGGKLDISVMINDYKTAESKVEYLIKHGTEMKLKAKETADHLRNILIAPLWNTIETYAPEGDQRDTFLLLKEEITKAADTLEIATSMDWSATEKVLVKEGLTTFQFKTLEDAIALTNGVFTDVELKNPLRVADAKVRFNMSMFDVTVKVAINYVDDNNKIVEYPVKPSVVLTLGEGASADDVLTAIENSGIENKALTQDFDGIYVDGKFDVEKTVLADKLVSDTLYTITYTPKKFAVSTDYDGTTEYPYGYVITLPSHEDNLKAYDYTVNGLACAQGSEIRVLEPVQITRTEGKAYTQNDYYKIVADNYLTGKGAAILTSGAIKNDEKVSYRDPDNTNKIVTLEGTTLSAANYASDYQGLSWAPYSYTLSDGTVGYFAKNSNKVDIAGSFDTVTVTYRLTFTNFAKEDVEKDADLPNVLYNESKDQLSVLKSLGNQKANLGKMNLFVLDMLLGRVEKADISDEMKAHYTAVINDIIDNCLEPNENLKLYEIVKEYAPDDTSKKVDVLYFYYTNSDRLLKELEVFSGYMTDLLGEDAQFTALEKQDALKKIMEQVPETVLSAADKAELLEKIETLESTMKDYLGRLTKPNEAIDLESKNLATLTDALQAAGNTADIKVDEFLYVSNSKIAVMSEGKIAFTAVLNIEGGKNVTIISDTVNLGAVVPSKVIEDFVAKINAELAGQNVTEKIKFYETNFDAAIFDAFKGVNTNDIDQTEYEFTWTYKDFKVSVPGMDDQTVSFVDRVINLAPSNDPAYRNDYYINGTKLGNATVYNLTDADIEKVAAGMFNVTLDRVYILREELINYVNTLNSEIGSDALKFVLIENANGEYSIVLKVDASTPDALVNAMMGLAQGVVLGSYPYVGIGGEGFYADKTIHLQTIINAITSSGFGSQSIINAINADGSTNHMTLDGNVIGGENGKLGGKLIESTMQLGYNANETTNLAFYITLDNATEEFAQVRNVLADQLNGRFSFECKDGKFGITLNMPEKMYEAFLAVLVVTENLNINNINDVNGEITVTFINDMLIPLLKGDITVKTFENTAAKFGLDLNISSQKGVESAFAGFVNFYTNANFTYDETSGTATGNIGISGLIDKMGLGDLGDIIAEKDTGLDVAINIGLDNLGKEYEALFVDVRADGITNKIGLTDNVANKLRSMAAQSLVVLLDDIDGDLVVNTTTVLNLNGFTVKGDIVANGKTVIIDSYIDTDRIGTVEGNISGNAIITSGKYESDVTDFIKTGYEQTADGIVKNQFYTLVEEGKNVDIVVNADILDMREVPDVASLAIDIACDLLFNGYSSNYLELDGNMIYDISVSDLVGLYASANRKDAVVDEVVKMIDTAELSTFINTVLDDAFDFTSISTALANKTPIFEYGMITKPWDVEFVHVTEGDYITANITNGEGNEKVIRISVDGSDKNIEYLAELFAELGKTVSADINVNINHGKQANNLYVEVTADANVLVDWSNPDYAVMLSVIVADGIGAPNNAALVEGIEEYYATGSVAKLSNAFNHLTTGQLVTALKNISRDDSFTAMVNKLGLSSVIDSDVYELDELYSRIEKVLAFAVRKADISGGNRLVGSILDADGAYGISKENVEKILKRSFFNYNVSADVEITSAYVGVKLFDENYTEFNEPEFVDGHGDPVVANHSLVSAYKVDLNNKYIIIDIHPDGINADVFKSLLTFTANNADHVEVVYDAETITDEQLVKTGTVITATASNQKTTTTDEVEYTVIVLGDVNRDGYSGVADSIMICRELVGDLKGDEALTEIQKLACDINCTERVDIGDATRIANKYVTKWDEYESFLGEDDQ